MADDRGGDDDGGPRAFMPGRSRKRAETPEERAEREIAERRAAEERARCQHEITMAVLHLNRTHALVVLGGEARVVRDWPDEAGRMITQIISPRAFGIQHGNEWYETGDEPIALGQAWLQHPDRRDVLGLTFAPHGAPEDWWNLWRGFDVAPSDVPLETACPVFLDHLRANVCGGDADLFAWLMGWFAHMVQRPAERIGTAVALVGKMGTGKTKVGEVIGALFSRHYVLVDSERYVTGQFNVHMATCLLLESDESFWAGDKKSVGRLKSLVTSKMHMIEKKGVDAVMMPNYVRLLMTSNEAWTIPAGLEERRWAVFQVGELAMQNKPYFAAIDAEMEAGGRAALLGHLLRFDLDSVDVRTIPRTRALVDQKIHSLDAHDMWWLERLKEGAPTARWQHWPPYVVGTELYGSYHQFAERLGRQHKLSEEQLAMHLRQRVPPERPGGEVMPRKRVTVHDSDEMGRPTTRRPWVYALPKLDACRAHFEKLMGAEGMMGWGVDPASPEATQGRPDDVEDGA
jgi:hypothetical protein